MCSAPQPQPDPELEQRNDSDVRERAAENRKQLGLATGRTALNLTGGLGDTSQANVKKTTLGA